VPFIISQPNTDEEYKQYYHLRWKILRAPWGQPEGSEIDDIEKSCFHIIATDENQHVVGIARLQFNSSFEAQIRYMGVDEKFKRKNIGRALVNALEQQAKDSAHQQIVLDARESAVVFYERLGYKITNKSYLLFDSIQHFRMMKIL